MTTLGTHNRLDGAAPVSDFADVIFWTEAASPATLPGYRTRICDRQRDLMISVRVGLFGNLTPHYKRAHWGIRKVTPNRGTFWLTDDEAKVALVCEHRINAAFAPYKRGEALFRKTMWEMHTRMTLRIIRKLKRQGYEVHAGGDLNTPHGVRGYRGVLFEVGKHYDRLGSTRPLSDVQVLSPLGSDHNRLRATVR